MTCPQTNQPPESIVWNRLNTISDSLLGKCANQTHSTALFFQGAMPDFLVKQPPQQGIKLKLTNPPRKIVLFSHATAPTNQSIPIFPPTEPLTTTTSSSGPFITKKTTNPSLMDTYNPKLIFTFTISYSILARIWRVPSSGTASWLTTTHTFDPIVVNL